MNFSPIDTMEDTTGKTPETMKDESQIKRTSFSERIAMMVGMKSRDVAAEEPKAEKGRTIGTVSTITTDANQDDDQVKQGEQTPMEQHLNMKKQKLDQIDRKLKHSEEDREG